MAEPMTLRPRARAAVLPRRPARAVREGARAGRRRDPRPRGRGRARERAAAREAIAARRPRPRPRDRAGQPGRHRRLRRRPRALARRATARSWCRRPIAGCSTRCPPGSTSIALCETAAGVVDAHAALAEPGQRADVGRRGPRRLARRHLEPHADGATATSRARPRERAARRGRGRQGGDRRRAPRHRRPRRTARRGRGRRGLRVRRDRVHPPVAGRRDPRGVPADAPSRSRGRGGCWMPRPANEGVFRFEGGMVDGPVLRHAEAVVRRRGAASPTRVTIVIPSAPSSCSVSSVDRDGAELGERRDVGAAAGDARRAAGQLGDPVPPIGQQRRRRARCGSRRRSRSRMRGSRSTEAASASGSSSAAGSKPAFRSDLPIR